MDVLDPYYTQDMAVKAMGNFGRLSKANAYRVQGASVMGATNKGLKGHDSNTLSGFACGDLVMVVNIQTNKDDKYPGAIRFTRVLKVSGTDMTV